MSDLCVVDPNDDEHPNCLRADGDAYRMNPTLLRALAPPGKRLFSLRTRAGFFWVRADGFARATPVFDNWADYFCDGLTRTLHGEHEGFMNAELEIVVPPTYDFVRRFAVDVPPSVAIVDRRRWASTLRCLARSARSSTRTGAA